MKHLPKLILSSALTFLTVATSAQEEVTTACHPDSGEKIPYWPVTKYVQAKPKALKDLASLNQKYDDNKGFVIITTNDLTHHLTKLQSFISHKKSIGHRMFLITENDVANKFPKAKEYLAAGASPGRVRAHDIRTWLQENYQKLGLKYVLFIGDPHPETGDVPMLKYNQVKFKDDEKERRKISGYDLKNVQADGTIRFTGHSPTDYYFVNLTGKWDFNENGIIGDRGDRVEGGISTIANVFVGRFPYYGEKSKYGKASDMNILLQRSIDYDNEKDINWRYTLLNAKGFQRVTHALRSIHMENDIYEANGFNVIRDGFKKNTMGLPSVLEGFSGQVNASIEKLQKYPTGLIRFGGHGTPYAMAGLSSKTVEQHLNPNFPTVVRLGGCDVGKIEAPENLAYSVLRHKAIAVHGGTRSVSSFGGDREIGEEHSYPKLLLKGLSVGEAKWKNYEAIFTRLGEKPWSPPSITATMINVYGDPSVVPFRYGHKAPFPFLTRPASGFFTVISSTRYFSSVKPFELSLENDKDKAVTISLKSDAPWLKLEKTKLTLKPGQKTKVLASVKAEYANKITRGRNEAQIFLSSGNYTTTRRIVINVPIAEAKRVYTFEQDKKGIFTNIAEYQKEAGHGSSHFEAKLPKKATPKDLKGDEHLVEGKYGKAITTKKTTYSTHLSAFDQENFTIAFWLKVNQSKAPKMLYGDKFFSFSADGDQIITELANYHEDSIKLSAPVTWSNSWQHIALTVDQENGLAQLYINAKKVAEQKVKKQQVYASEKGKIGTSKFDGAIDEVQIHNKKYSQAQIKSLMNNDYFIKPTPKNYAQNLAGKTVRFDFISPVKDNSVVYLKENKKGAKIVKIEANEKGEFIAPVKEETAYSWMISNGKEKSQTWSFSTSKNYLTSLEDEDAKTAWDGGQIGYVERLKFTTLSLKDKQSTTSLSTYPMEASAYTLTFKSRPKGPNPSITAEVFYNDGKEDIVIQKQSFDKKQLRSKSEMNFLLTRDHQALNKKVKIRFTAYEGTVYLDNLAMFPYSSKSNNAAPKLTTDPKTLSLNANIGDNTFSLDLRSIVKDPEGLALTFEKIDGPSWLYINSNSLFTNFGPKAKDKGQNTFKVAAIDPQGARTEFTIKVTVN